MEALKNINSLNAEGKRLMMRIGISTDYGWFELKRKLIQALNAIGYELTDIGDYELIAGENYPDFIVPMANAVTDGNDEQNRSDWLNGMKACTEVNKIPGICAALITEPSGFCVKIGDEDLYVRCLGGQIKGYALSKKKVMNFLNADCVTSIPTNQRLAKMRVLGINKKIAERKKYLA